MVAFSGGGFHLQIQQAILGYKMKMSLRSKKIPSIVYFCHFLSATAEELGMAEG